MFQRPKFSNRAEERSNALDLWLYFLNNGPWLDPDDLPYPLRMAEVEEAVNLLRKLTQEELERERYEDREKARRDALSRAGDRESEHAQLQQEWARLEKGWAAIQQRWAAIRQGLAEMKQTWAEMHRLRAELGRRRAELGQQMAKIERRWVEMEFLAADILAQNRKSPMPPDEAPDMSPRPTEGQLFRRHYEAREKVRQEAWNWIAEREREHAEIRNGLSELEQARLEIELQEAKIEQQRAGIQRPQLEIEQPETRARAQGLVDQVRLCEQFLRCDPRPDEQLRAMSVEELQALVEQLRSQAIRRE